MDRTLVGAVQALLHGAGLPDLRTWTPLGGGYANDLYRLRLAGPPGTVVARCWRRAPGQAATELAVMRRAAAAVPVPRVLAADLSGPRPAALLEDVAGLNAEAALLASPDEAEQIGEELGRAFGQLSALNFTQPGLFGGPDLLPLPWADASPVRQLLGYARPLVWNDAARAALGESAQAALWALIEEHAPLLAPLEGQAHLVHADANPKNMMLRRGPGGWRLAAVLDWEFAFSGASLTDLGNLLRFEPRAGSAHASGVVRGWKEGGGAAPQDFVTLARLLDLYSLLEFLNRPEAALHGAVLTLLSRNAAQGQL